MKNFLSVDDVARILGEERARRQGKPLSQAEPLSHNSVLVYWRRYRAGGEEYRQMALRNPDRDPNAKVYEENPFPEPEKIGRDLAWLVNPARGEKTIADVEANIRKWYRGRPKPGAGGGKKAKTKAKVKKPVRKKSSRTS